MNIPIFLSSDNNFAPYIATTIASICDNTKSFCEFFILDGGIKESNKEKILELKRLFNNFTIEFIDITDKINKQIVNDRYYSSTMYARFLIPELKRDIDRAIYSDVDVIVVDDIAEMYLEDLDKFILGAVQAPFVNNANKSYMHYPDGHVYFCSGNLLIDCKSWRERNITNTLFQLYDKYKDEIKSPDQDILNKCFENNYKPLPIQYCVTEFHKKYYKSIDKNIDKTTIIHYGTEIKPWQISPTTRTTLYKDLGVFWEYAKKTPFYEELLSKVQNKEEQSSLLRRMQIDKIRAKGFLK